MQPKIARRILGLLAALLVLGLVVLWLWPLPPSGVDVSVLPPGDPAQAEALMEEIDAYIREVEETYAQAISRRRLLTALGIIGIGTLLLTREGRKEGPEKNNDE